MDPKLAAQQYEAWQQHYGQGGGPPNQQPVPPQDAGYKGYFSGDSAPQPLMSAGRESSRWQQPPPSGPPPPIQYGSGGQTGAGARPGSYRGGYQADYDSASRTGGGSSYGAGGDESGGPAPANKVIFVSGLPQHANETFIYDVFQTEGPIEINEANGKPKIKIYMDHGVSKGECTIMFESEGAAQKIVDVMNGRNFPGTENVMSVSIAKFSGSSGRGRGGDRGGFRGRGRGDFDRGGFRGRDRNDFGGRGGYNRDSGPPRDRDSGPPRDRDSGPPRDRDSGNDRSSGFGNRDFGGGDRRSGGYNDRESSRGRGNVQDRGSGFRGRESGYSGRSGGYDNPRGDREPYRGGREDFGGHRGGREEFGGHRGGREDFGGSRGGPRGRAPGNGESRQGDWNCPCGNNNFAFRTECNSCRQPRADGGGQVRGPPRSSDPRHRPY